MLETFVVNEVRKQAAWARTEVALHHYRDRDGVEVDIVLEAADGRVCGVEVKASGRVQTGDLKVCDFCVIGSGLDSSMGSCSTAGRSRANWRIG